MDKRLVSCEKIKCVVSDWNGMRLQPDFLYTRVAVCAITLVIAGCDRNAPFDIVPTSGKVQYDDGTPIPGNRLVVEFHSQTPPKNAKTHPRKGVAECDRDGNFKTVTTWKYGDGAIVGPQKIVLLALDGQQQQTGAVPSEYANPSSTPLAVEVKAGGPPLEFKIPNPKR
jgi:hypothetical protein